VPELEQQLAELADAIEWPPTPELYRGLSLAPFSPSPLSLSLRARRGKDARFARLIDRSRLRGRGRPPWAFAAAAVLVIVATLFAYTPSRQAIASWVNLHVFIQRTHNLPTPSPLASGSLGSQLGLGRPVTLAEAQRDVTWHITVPGQLGPPDAVYYQAPPEGPALGEVSLVYGTRPGIAVAGQTGVAVLITEARGTIDQNFFGKMLGSSATLEQVTVNGSEAFWISGPLNVFFFIDADGNFRNETMRPAANTLIFDDHGTVVRIEGSFTKDQAIKIAASMS